MHRCAGDDIFSSIGGQLHDYNFEHQPPAFSLFLPFGIQALEAFIDL
jgi:hypothetical protein